MRFYAPKRIDIGTRILKPGTWYELRGREKRHENVQRILNNYIEG